MPKFNINNYTGKYCMHCKTEEEAKSFCKYLHNIGRRWCTGRSYLDQTSYICYGSDTAYNFNEGSYADVYYYRRNGYVILQWRDFMNATFTKADLKTGDIILRRDDSVEIVNLELDMLIRKSGWNDLNAIREDLTYVNDSKYDIIAVRRPVVKGDCTFNAFKNEHGILVYERPAVEEMTLAEVCKALGKEIKIVKE
jgi:hypothetical protein